MTAVSDSAKLTESPPEATFIGNVVTFKNEVVAHAGSDEDEVQEIPVTLPATCKEVLASPKLEMIVVFAFCVVAKPMLRTTKASAAATITNAIITMADSKPLTPLWACPCPFLIRFNDF